jgi:VIT1/CCC1 family predicted Fe2+/Mn2+ transporter
MDDGLKNKAYLEGTRLKNAGMDDEVIYARLEKQGIPDELARNVIKNLNVQKKVEKVKEQQPLYYSGLLKIALGVLFAIISYFIFPGKIILPIGFIISGILYALIAKQNMKS